MSKEHAKQFLERLDQDPEFKKKWMNSTREETKKIIEQEDLDFTHEEFSEAYQEKIGRELNQEELAQIAGGMHPGLSGTVLGQYSA